MSVAAVAIDDWKIPILRKHLDAAGYKYEEPKPFVDQTSIVRVTYEWAHKLQGVLEKAAEEWNGVAARSARSSTSSIPRSTRRSKRS